MNNSFKWCIPAEYCWKSSSAPRGVSVWHLAQDIGVPARRIYEIVQGQRPITADIAHRLAHELGMSERYWLDLQARYDREYEKKPSAGNLRLKQSLRWARSALC